MRCQMEFTKTETQMISEVVQAAKRLQELLETRSERSNTRYDQGFYSPYRTDEDDKIEAAKNDVRRAVADLI